MIKSAHDTKWSGQWQIVNRLQERGFTLLLAVVLSLIIITIGLSVLNSTLKQLLLSDIALESERAFHAAYAGVECAEFWNTGDAWDVSVPAQNIRCGDQNAMTVVEYSDNTTADAGSLANEIKSVQFDWPSADPVCTSVRVYKYAPSANIVIPASIIPAPNTSALRSCNGGTECTVTVSRGYNRPCADLADVRTVERELTVRF